MNRLTDMQRRTAIGLFAVVATLASFPTLIPSPFDCSSVCDRCGALRNTTDWQIPMAEFTLFSHSTESESRLSRALLTNRIVQPHEHRWLFAHGGGRVLRSCAIGPGRHLRPLADSEEFARLVIALHNHGQSAFRDRLLRGVFNPHTSSLFRGLSFITLPEPITDATMKVWVDKACSYLGAMVVPLPQR